MPCGTSSYQVWYKCVVLHGSARMNNYWSPTSKAFSVTWWGRHSPPDKEMGKKKKNELKGRNEMTCKDCLAKCVNVTHGAV